METGKGSVPTSLKRTISGIGFLAALMGLPLIPGYLCATLTLAIEGDPDEIGWGILLLALLVLSVGAGGATAPDDYVSASGTLIFSPGSTTQPITVTLKGDTALEPDEVFDLHLTNPDPVALEAESSSGWILNDDEESPFSFFVFLPAVQRGP